MIKAKPYQQQPPNPVTCNQCGESFNTERRLLDHQRSPHIACETPTENNHGLTDKSLDHTNEKGK